MSLSNKVIKKIDLLSFDQQSLSFNSKTHAKRTQQQSLALTKFYTLNSRIICVWSLRRRVCMYEHELSLSDAQDDLTRWKYETFGG